MATEIECRECRKIPDEWIVESVDHDAGGTVQQARFSGPEAKQRAIAYEQWLRESAL